MGILMTTTAGIINLSENFKSVAQYLRYRSHYAVGFASLLDAMSLLLMQLTNPDTVRLGRRFSPVRSIRKPSPRG